PRKDRITTPLFTNAYSSKRTMTSPSEFVRKAQPFLLSSSRISCAFAMSPLFARAISPYEVFFFFFITRPPPRSTLFPYTTLFRSDASYKDVTRVHSKPLSEMTATFYCTQRKLPFAPVLGHERLIRLLVDSQIDRPRLRFLEQDRGGLQRFAKAIEDIQFAGTIRAVRPGTIMFPQQPFADITGRFGLTQAQ